MEKLLTISIPTYNRAQALERTLVCLSKCICSFEAIIEVVVSDNCSQDQTSAVVESWVKSQSPDLEVRYVRHEENIGMSRNLVSLIYEARAEYFIFIGDDDQINPNNFSKLVKLLVEKRPSAVVQGLWSGHMRMNKRGSVSFEEAYKLFYEYGNAWAGVVNRAAAVNAIESRSLRMDIESIVWPQTVFGYLAMFDLSSTRSIEVVDFEIGGPLVESMNITNKSYWVRSLNDLLKAASLIQKHTNSTLLGSRLFSFYSYGLMAHLKLIFWNSLLEKEKVSLFDLRETMRKQFGWRGWFFSIIVWVDSFPKALWLIFVFFRFFNPKNGISVGREIKEAKLRRRVEIENKEKSGKRYGDWF